MRDGRNRTWAESPGGLLATKVYGIAPPSMILDLKSDRDFLDAYNRIIAFVNRVVLEEEDGLLKDEIKAPNGDASRVNWWRALELWETRRSINTMLAGEAVLDALRTIFKNETWRFRMDVFQNKVANPAFW